MDFASQSSLQAARGAALPAEKHIAPPVISSLYRTRSLGVLRGLTSSFVYDLLNLIPGIDIRLGVPHSPPLVTRHLWLSDKVDFGLQSSMEQMELFGLKKGTWPESKIQASKSCIYTVLFPWPWLTLNRPFWRSRIWKLSENLKISDDLVKRRKMHSGEKTGEVHKPHTNLNRRLTKTSFLLFTLHSPADKMVSKHGSHLKYFCEYWLNII